MIMIDPSTTIYPHRLRRLYWPFLALAEVCREVVGTVAGSFTESERRYTIPRFTFLGPEMAAEPQKRIGLFALLHGDEPAGSTALLRLLEAVVNCPAIAAGCDLVFYPVCNPTGYEDQTRHNRAGRDFDREFWSKSDQPEIRILEEELSKESFDGIVTLHTDERSERLSIRNAADGTNRALRPPPELQPQPFEVVIDTPGRAAVELQAEAARGALQTILAEYRWGAARERKI
jgi:protein MpaA